MFRKYMIFVLAAFMVIGTNACTSKKASDETADVEQSAGDESIEAAEATENNDDLAMDGVENGGDAVADLGGATDDLAPDEKLPDDQVAAPSDTVAADPGAPTDMGDTPPSEQAAGEPIPPPEPGADEQAGMAAEPAPPVEEPAASEPAPEPAPITESKPVATLLKMKSTPEKHGKILVNALYVARKGDSPESISQKVFGTKDKVKELCKVNSYNCSRPVKVGDKFYYNSPQRPDDDTVVKTFYEDAGIAPQIYTAQSGDNIRKVGKQLLGDSRSWQEIWATNDVESKGDLEEGTKLRYWPDTAAAPEQAVAQSEEAQPAEPPAEEVAQGEAQPADAGQEAAPIPDQAASAPPPPPPPPEAAAQVPTDALPPAPPDQAAAAGMVEPPAPPPPPPPTEMHKDPAAIDGGTDPNETMALGVGAVLLLAAAALFISIRKKRARRQIDFNTTTQTQIE